MLKYQTDLRSQSKTAHNFAKGPNFQLKKKKNFFIIFPIKIYLSISLSYAYLCNDDCLVGGVV